METNTNLPIAITMGDASGVGPEIIIKSFQDHQLPEKTVVYGDLSILEAGSSHLKLSTQFNVIESPNQYQPGEFNLIDTSTLVSDDWTPGKLNARAGAASYEYVIQATTAALEGQVSAVVTLPINKEATQMSHADFTGHTELLAELCQAERVVMMLACEQVAVSHVSTHVSLKKAIEQLTPENLRTAIHLTHSILSRFVETPRIGVCGLNPHAGESGMFGDEEQNIIEPVLDQLRRDNINVNGPYPADTVFREAIHKDRFDALICMYHDQGHAPMKLYAFDTAVNVTLGLPIIRTSVDHGTAFDIAWQNKASTRSLKSAISYAQQLL